ncbi:uncharacterized protein BDV17DRAFT_291226 [Aspergillus undulatus]|uniref:uncharacterized protein n=1 Tax=Aspergillus undulatus TaxID=1810928 RepID=UPI003CCDAA50
MRLIKLVLLIACFAAVASAHTVTCWGDDRRKAGTHKGTKAGIEFLEKIQKGNWKDLDKAGMTRFEYEHGRYKFVSARPSSCEQIHCHDDGKGLYSAIWFCNDEWTKVRSMEIEHVLEAIWIIKEDCEVANDAMFVGGELLQPDLWRVKIQKPKKGQCYKKWPALGDVPNIPNCAYDACK